jgi:colanic acid biosynthesis glycosyl transferase WcaI
MNILVLMLYWYPYEGPLMPIYGAILRSLMKKGHKVTIVTSFPHFRKGRSETWEKYRGKLCEVTEWEGARIIRCYVYAPVFDQTKSGLIYRAFNFVSFNISSLLAATVLAGKADVVLAPSSPPLTNGLIASIVSRFKRCPSVYNVQDLYPDMANKMGIIRNRLLLQFLLLLERWVYSFSHKVIVISNGMKKILEQKGVALEKVRVIKNSIDTEFITPRSQDNPFSRKYRLHDYFVVMYAGNIGIPHGVEVLIEAAEMLMLENDLVFCFVGRGENKHQIESLARRKGLTNAVFVDPQPEKMVPLIWATAAVGMITYRKGLADFSVPSKLLAIMCAARPAIASVDENSDTVELIKKAGCGLCVEPESPLALANAIRHLKSDAASREDMGQRGRHYVEENLNRRIISSHYEKVFADLTRSKTA